MPFVNRRSTPISGPARQTDLSLVARVALLSGPARQVVMSATRRVTASSGLGRGES